MTIVNTCNLFSPMLLCMSIMSYVTLWVGKCWIQNHVWNTFDLNLETSGEQIILKYSWALQSAIRFCLFLISRGKHLNFFMKAPVQRWLVCTSWSRYWKVLYDFTNTRKKEKQNCCFMWGMILSLRYLLSQKCGKDFILNTWRFWFCKFSGGYFAGVSHYTKHLEVVICLKYNFCH